MVAFVGKPSDLTTELPIAKSCCPPQNHRFVNLPELKAVLHLIYLRNCFYSPLLVLDHLSYRMRWHFQKWKFQSIKLEDKCPQLQVHQISVCHKSLSILHLSIQFYCPIYFSINQSRPGNGRTIWNVNNSICIGSVLFPLMVIISDKFQLLLRWKVTLLIFITWNNIHRCYFYFCIGGYSIVGLIVEVRTSVKPLFFKFNSFEDRYQAYIKT